MNENTNNIRTAEEVTAAILEYFRENEDVFNEAIEELDGWNGYLGDDRYYDMYELDEFYHDTDPLELLQRVYYGWDEDSYTVTETGERRHDEFCPNRDYFRYNGYGNLVSADYKDYSDHMDEYAVEAMQDNRAHLDTIDNNDELAALFDELDAIAERASDEA